MAMIKCKECGNDVSNRAEKCPHCGNPVNPSPPFIGIGCLAIIIIYTAWYVFDKLFG